MSSTSSSTPINLRPVSQTARGIPKHPAPTASAAGWSLKYAPSKDGREGNLLVLLHGLGDTNEPFFRLGQQFSLPGTCVLSLQGNVPIPLMDTPSWSWYPTFGTSFPHLPIPAPSPDKAVSALRELLSYLTGPLDPPKGSTAGCGWNLNQIHLFGWGQGGTTALELARSVGVESLPEAPPPESGTATAKRARRRLGSATSICGPLLHTPPVGAPALDLATPICYFHRPRGASREAPTAITRTFKHVRSLAGAYARAQADDQGNDIGMPRGEVEWRGVMRFWSEVLGRDEGWKGEGEVYEVVR